MAGGSLAFGLTDTDDAIVEIEKGMPVAIVYPDQADGQVGTLFIPNTLALIKGSPHPKEAEKLLDYLLSADVERRLADGPSAQIPLRPGVPASPRVKTPPEVRAMEVDWSAAAEKWDTAAEFLKDGIHSPINAVDRVLSRIRRSRRESRISSREARYYTDGRAYTRIRLLNCRSRCCGGGRHVYS